MKTITMALLEFSAMIGSIVLAIAAVLALAVGVGVVVKTAMDVWKMNKK